MCKRGWACGTSRGPIPAKISAAKKAHCDSPSRARLREEREAEDERRPFLSSPPSTLPPSLLQSPFLSRLGRGSPPANHAHAAVSAHASRAFHCTQIREEQKGDKDQRKHSSRAAVPAMSMDEGYGPTWDSDDEYDNFIRKMNPPRIVVDNDSCAEATIVRVDSANEYGILLEVIQVLIDLNLVISKAYITSDGGWFMDVFNVTDKEGKKLRDKATLAQIEDYVRKSLGADSRYIPSRRKSVGVAAAADHNVIELTGTDRPGLLSEISAVLANLKCNVVSAEIWTHNTRAAAVMRVTDEDTGLAVTDTERLGRIKERLSYLLRGSNLSQGAAMALSSGTGTTHTERRLHQMMIDDGDCEQLQRHAPDQSQRPNVTVRNWNDKDYSVVTIRCKDRSKLLFDTVCTLTDLHYVVFHANIDAKDNQAYQEFYVRHVNGSPMNTETERLRVIQCLEAAIERRVSEGVKLELCSNDKVGLLSEVTRIFRENSLTVTRAEVSTRGRMAVNTFYVRGSAGEAVDQKTIDAIRQAIGQNIQVKGQPEPPEPQKKESPTWFLFANLFRPRSLYIFGLFMH